MFIHAATRALCKNKTQRYRVPMLLIGGGSFHLCEFSHICYDAVKIKIDPELEKKKLKMKEVTLESEYEKIVFRVSRIECQIAHVSRKKENLK